MVAFVAEVHKARWSPPRVRSMSEGNPSCCRKKTILGTVERGAAAELSQRFAIPSSKIGRLPSERSEACQGSLQYRARGASSRSQVNSGRDSRIAVAQAS